MANHLVRWPRSRMRSLGASLAVVTLLVAACGPGTATSPPVTATGAPSPASPAASATTSPAATTPSDTGTTFDPSALTLRVEVISGGLEDPVDVAVPGDGSGRVFVVEQAGRIRTIRDGALVETPFLDIRGRIASGGERGLLGLAFHPGFPDDPRFFVNYTDLDGDTVVAEYRLDEADPETGDPASERILVQFDQPFPNHNGGAVVFGPDGTLYIATGDGGSGGDPLGNGQRLDTMLAKILRIDVDSEGDGDRAYGIPEDNPFLAEAGAMPEIWLTGLRNPWRIRFDEATGDLWIGDVGQDAWEEIDVARAGTAGLNFGWNSMEGFECFEPREGCDKTGLTLPVAAYGQDFGCAVIGGVVVRDSDQPLLNGGYVFSDSCSGNLWVLDPADDGPQEPTIVADSGRSISSISLDADGTVVATDRSGELVRITAESP